ncbi:MAG: hypothetical protein K2K47_00320 [Duncaniella sp.]|nr:hypothetical protein [Duncaniella sp.]
MNETKIIFTLDAAATLRHTVESLAPSADDTVITDSTVASVVLPSLSLPDDLHVITFPAGEANKNLSTCAHLWQSMSRSGVNRRSLVVNIGGGVTTDMGGFVSATFKRGVRFINIPTCLL